MNVDYENTIKSSAKFFLVIVFRNRTEKNIKTQLGETTITPKTPKDF